MPPSMFFQTVIYPKLETQDKWLNGLSKKVQSVYEICQNYFPTYVTVIHTTD